MKAIVCLCFIAGLAAGWWIPGISGGTRNSQENSISMASTASASNGDLETPPSIRQVKDHMEISRERLKELLKADTSSAVSVDSFYNGMNPGRWQAVESLADWAQLDVGEKQAIMTILTDAAKTRMAWEKANVKVESPTPGKWMLRFPGDQGQARDNLRRKIESTFEPEKAVAIWLSGDLDNFFGLGMISPEFRNGQVEVRAATNGKLLADPANAKIFFKIPIAEKEFLFEIASPDLENNPFFGRLLGLLGTPEEIRKSAAATERDGPISN